MSDAIALHSSWKDPLLPEFSSPYMAALREFLVAEKASGKRIFPKGAEWFRALDLTPLDDPDLLRFAHAYAQRQGLTPVTRG